MIPPKTDDSTKTDTKAKGEQDMEGDLTDMHVKIVSAVRSGNDYNNQPTVLVTYEWTNTTDKNNSFAVLANPKVFQKRSGTRHRHVLGQSGRLRFRLLSV